MKAKDKVDRLSQFPRRSLEDCLRLGKQLLTKIGSSQVEPQVAIGAIGYTTMNGAAMSTLGALRQYGLIDRPRGKGVSASAILVKAAHSNDHALLVEVAFRPTVFRQLREGGYETCADDVLMKQLEGRGLTSRAAREAVNVFRANTTFLGAAPNSPVFSSTAPPPAEPSKPAPSPAKQLAAYSFPLAGCDASLVFSGTRLGPEDLAILREHLDVISRTLAKRQP